MRLQATSAPQGHPANANVEFPGACPAPQVLEQDQSQPGSFHACPGRCETTGRKEEKRNHWSGSQGNVLERPPGRPYAPGYHGGSTYPQGAQDVRTQNSVPCPDLGSRNQNRHEGHVAVTTPTPTGGKPPGPVTWGTRWKSRYKGREKKRFEEETAPSMRVTLERRKWVIQSRPARSRGTHFWNSLSIPPITGPSLFSGLWGMERYPFLQRELATESLRKGLPLQCPTTAR